MADDGQEDYIIYGTPIEREEDLAGRKRKMSVEMGQLRRLPPWQQEVTDEEGRRRFHGAFTGGFSAGFYNTVGSKEGWAPQTFMSSRKKRADVKGQTIYNFLDDDEKAELEAQELSTSSQFDTFGFTAADVARKEAEKELQKRPSAIPGPVPDEIIVPAAESIGVKLLLKMGWRYGRSIGAGYLASMSESRRDARKAFLAFAHSDEPRVSPKKVYGAQRASYLQNEYIKDAKDNGSEGDEDVAVHVPRTTPVFVINPKNDLYGLGYDPFRNAPEFREKKQMHSSGEKGIIHSKSGRLKGNLFRPNAGKAATGFGIGALEDLDEEDEDIYTSGLDFDAALVEEFEGPSRMLEEKKERPIKSHGGILPGFKVATVSCCRTEWFVAPVVPPSFVPEHKFSVPLEVERKFCEPPPLEVPPPEDTELQMMIEGLATFVARSGKLFEDLSREKNANNPLFCFLSGGPGHDYYKRKLWEEQKKLAEQGKLKFEKTSEMQRQKLNSEDRGKVLGEIPLERSSDSVRSSIPSGDVARLQSILFDTFTKPTSLLEGAATIQPFRDDPAKQERFEQFLKDKYQGGLRSTYAGGNSNRTELERARERLDFEAAVEMIEKGGLSKKNSMAANQHLWERMATVESRFTSVGVESMDPMKQQRINEKGGNVETKAFPRREEHQWRPSLLLCKRFNLLDPYAGKPPPLPKARSKMESVILISNPVQDLPETSLASEDKFDLTGKPASQSALEVVKANEENTEKEVGIETRDIIVKKPVDLYKAIFSDESDTEAEEYNEKQLDNQEKTAEGANATLNRLIAGDFLESLGKELGLKVPTDSGLALKGKDVPMPMKERKSMEEGESVTRNDKLVLPNSPTRKSLARSLDENPKISVGESMISKNKQKLDDAYKIEEVRATKISGLDEGNTIQPESGKNDPVFKSLRHDAFDNSSSDYDRYKDKERRKKRGSRHRERDKMHSRKHHQRRHKSQEDHRRKRRYRDKERHGHKRYKSEKHLGRTSTSSSSSSESSH